LRVLQARSSLKRLMTAVAMLALVFAAAEQLRRRRETFLHKAAVFRQKTSESLLTGQIVRSNRFNMGYPPESYFDKWGDHYDALRVKYEKAAVRPWRFVEPDPSAPVWPENP